MVIHISVGLILVGLYVGRPRGPDGYERMPVPLQCTMGLTALCAPSAGPRGMGSRRSASGGLPTGPERGSRRRRAHNKFFQTSLQRDLNVTVN